MRNPFCRLNGNNRIANAYIRSGRIANPTEREIRPSGREGAQIDLVIDRADRMVHLCEMKFSVGPYELKDAYEKKLRQRMTIFREATKCSKALVNTFVTTFGVADGMHKSIVNSEVILDELFN